MIASKSSLRETSNEKIKVVVRVRPLNADERIRGHQNVIQIEESQPNTITIWDPTGIDAMTRPELQNIDPSCWARNFSYDCCIHSSSDDESTSSQERVFDIVGQPVVNWAVDGFNSCVLAYGQTGAGKSFTMMGNESPAEFGLIPRICFGLFEHFETFEDDPDVDCSMEFSFVEIYNESLRDCLSPQNNGALKVREDPRDGTYITHLTVVAVRTFEDILSLITVGNRNRSVASTKANLQSSRSHSIVTLTVRQRSRGASVDGLRTSAIKQKLSKIHLVDLAGSERVTHSGAVGMRLREANHINKSLSVLGDVIKCLGEAAKLKNPGHIPYRNSVLTMVLRHSLGGNSRTIMVAAVSPSSMDYEESVSTLKYADNAKKVRMRVAANVSSGLLASDGGAMQLVPILQAEVKKLRDLLQAQHNSQQQRGVGDMIGTGDESMEIVREMRARVEELEEQLQEREKLIKSLELARSSDAFVRESNSHVSLDSSLSSIPSVDEITQSRVGNYMRSQPLVVLADDAVDTSLPRLINLNQDPLFSECLVYYIPSGTAVAGSSEADVDILLSGPDILSQHCLLHNESDAVWITPSSVDSKVFVNGELLQPPSPHLTADTNERFYLRHFDRISMGRYHLFRFEGKGKSRSMSPMKGALVKGVAATFSREAPGWDFAHDELMLNKDSKIMAPRSRSADGNGGEEAPSRFDMSPKRRERHQPPDSFSTSSRRERFDLPHKVTRSVAEVVSQAAENHQVVPPKSLTVQAPAPPSDGEEWWDKVTKVAEGAVRVNTPSELRAMLRSVVESAEKQFEDSERMRMEKTHTASLKHSEPAVLSTPYVSEDVIEEEARSSESRAPMSSVRQGIAASNQVDSRSNRSAISNVSTTATETPPPPPQSQEDLYPPRIASIPSSSSAADILYVERKNSSAANRYSNSATSIGDSRRELSSTRQVIGPTTNRPRDAFSNDVESSRGARNDPARPVATDGGMKFEDEATSLQKDMILMQQKLRDRMQRFKS